MKRNVSVVCVCSVPNTLISGKTIKEMPGSVASGTRCIRVHLVGFLYKFFSLSIYVFVQL
jgi:hypothetical protein